MYVIVLCIIQSDRNFALRILEITDIYSSVHFDWINEQKITLWLNQSTCRSRHVVTRFCGPVLHLSINSPSAQMFLSHVQKLCIVECSLTFRPSLPCWTPFWDTFPNSTVLDKSIISLPANFFRHWNWINLQQCRYGHEENLNARIAEQGGYFQCLI